MAAKIFEVGDVLPIGRVKINWDCSSLFCSSSYQFNIWGSDASFLIRVENNSGGILDETVIFIGDNLDYPSFEYLETDDLVGSYTIRLSNEITIGYVSSWIADFFTWEVAPPGFSVTFEENDGSTVTDLTEQTALPNPLPTPTKSGYTFRGWFYDSDFTNEALAGDLLTGDVTLYAKWQINTYTVAFYSDGGSSIPSINDVTKLPNPLPIPTKENHSFLGWYYDSDFTNEAFADDPLTGNVTLYAKWELNTYTITYNSNGGSSIPQTSDAIQLPSPLPTPTKRGYKFVAWYYESNFQTRAKAGDTIEANTTLYAKWHNLRTLFIGIANAIRSKDRTSGNIRALDFDDRIMAIAEGKPIEVSTAAAMDNLLVSGNVGKIYKFIGPTDANYINGELYEVVSDSGTTVPQENTYLTFQSTSSFTLKVNDTTKHWDGTLYYSTDTTTWNVWDGTVITSSVDNKLYLRGTGNTIITGDEPDYGWVLTGSNIECIGNIENLLDWETVVSGNHPSMEAYCYAYLFLDCVALVSAPTLPAKTLTERCYSYMFYGCTALASPPALPATTLANHCYNRMFYGCTALTSAPALPATTLADYCYSYMFAECRSLTSPPALPATTLADSCYESMFLWCTALTSTPTLPATTLASSCYDGMFQRCTALTSAPALPVTTLADRCYAYMFQGCTALASAPDLPATTLADSCYRSMFNGCTGLTTAPSLPATTLADDCYRQMFYGCTKLTTAPDLPATTLADYCYYYMFSECRALASAPALPATTLADCCYYGMFSGCIELTTVPSLPATTLTYECYRQMFQYCPKIKVSAVQGGIYQHAWRIPTSGTGTEATNWNLLMLNNTGGTFTGNPDINTAYYVENPPVSEFNITINGELYEVVSD